LTCAGSADQKRGHRLHRTDEGYETYLAAAFTKKHVPPIVVADKDKAEYIITSTVAHKDLSGGQPAVVVTLACVISGTDC
jgi:hypothetical protein